LRSSAIPHFGQVPGLSDSTPGHIGQKYFAAAEGFTSFAECSWPPQQECAAGFVGGEWESSPWFIGAP